MTFVGIWRYINKTVYLKSDEWLIKNFKKSNLKIESCSEKSANEPN